MKDLMVRAWSEFGLVEGYAISKDCFYVFDGNKEIPVEEDTICTCTGVTDTNGSLIFEGDILFSESSGQFYVPRYCKESASYRLVCLGFGGRSEDMNKMLIVGNIFEKTLPTIILNGHS